MTPDRLAEIEALADGIAQCESPCQKCEDERRVALRDLLASYRALQADLRTVEAISLGRRTVLIEQAHDLANQWKRAERAEAEAAHYKAMWEGLKAWLDDQHDLAPDYRRCADPVGVLDKMSELEAAHKGEQR